MKSIRLYLLVFLALALAAATAVLGALLFGSTQHEVDELYNTHLLQVGMVLSEHERGQQDCGWTSAQPSALENAAQRVDESEFLLQTWSLDGRLLHTTHPELQLPLQGALGFADVRYGKREWRVFRFDNPDCILQVAQPDSARHEAVREMTHHILVPALLQLPLLGLLIWLAVGRGLRPLNVLSQAIRGRSPAVLDPLPEAGLPNEIKPLVQALNQLLERLDAALRAQRQFTADAAHELRSPLTALQLQLDLALRATSDAERDWALAQLAAGIQRGNRLVQQLLTLARLEPDAQSKAFSPVPVDAMARGVVGEVMLQALARNIDLGIERCEALVVSGDRNSLEILLGNLLDNAIRYSPEHSPANQGRIDVSVYRNGEQAVIDVTDNGAGIPESERLRVFDRFYRVEGSGVTGTGLGLAIVQSIATRHGGSVQALANPHGRGTLMRVELPLAASC